MKELISCIKNLPKHFVTACKNIWRNSAMSISSIFAVTITLLIIGVIGLMTVSIQDMTYQMENGLTIHVKMEREATKENVEATQTAIRAIPHVASVTYSSKEDELDKLVESFGEDGEIFNSEEYRGSGNPLGDAFVVEADDALFLKEVATKIQDLDMVNKVNYGGSETMELVNTLETVRNFGTIFILALTAVALFMITNTIKLTINSRSVEISIMRLVGASNWYIRIPFMMEGMIIGFLGSIVPIIGLYFGYQSFYDMTKAGHSFAMGLISLREPFPFIWQFSGVLVILGSVVGLLGSFNSVRKFLKY